MISWDIALGLCVLAFALPFIFMSSKMKNARDRAAATRHEAKQLRIMLRDLEDKVRHNQSLILESLGVPFILLRPSGRAEMANKKAADLLGGDSIIHGNMLRLLPESDLKSFLQEASNATDAIRRDVSVGQGDAQKIYRAKAMPLNNRERHIGIVFLDVTEERRTQIIRRDFVANASHELRTPLTLIIGYLDTLLDDPDMAEDAAVRQRSLGIMKRHADRMARLISDMLMLSRVDAPDSGYLKHEEFDLHQLAADVIMRLQPMIDEQRAKVEINIALNPFMMMGDSFYWSQVIFNLLENALKNNPTPGLSVKLNALMAADGSRSIRVEDNGVGSAAEALPYIFNRFYRADSTGKIKGTGLGLAIVRNAVEAHGGSISAESIPGQRTTFNIHLPAPVVQQG